MQKNVQGITILGATGTVGINTLDVISRHADRFHVVAISANQNVERMLDLCILHKPQFAVMADEQAADKLTHGLRKKNTDIEVLHGEKGLCHVCALDNVNTVMAAIVGAAGLIPTLAAVRAGKRVLLANKEVLVMSGSVFMDEVRRNGAELLPIDSEHNAIFQCMPHSNNYSAMTNGIRHIWLTASGGPFLDLPLNELSKVTPDQACAHPNWIMGRKISVDSATMMNKGLEIIEAHWLFGIAVEQIQVVIHPQSIVHSMVAYNDGSILAQLGNPDMRTPIAHALAWPDRLESGVEDLDIFNMEQLNFEQPDYDRFPCLRLAYDALAQGGTATTVLNAANEIAVAAFLQYKICYIDIVTVIEETLSQADMQPADTIEIIRYADQHARNLARKCITRIRS